MSIAVLKSKQKMTVSLLYAHVVVKTKNLVISRCCFVEYGREMHGNSCLQVKLKAERTFLLLTNNILASWRCRSTSRRLCLNSLMVGRGGVLSPLHHPCSPNYGSDIFVNIFSREFSEVLNLI